MEITCWLIDNTVLSNFALNGKVELLRDCLRGKLALPEEVASEFLKGVDKGIDAGWALPAMSSSPKQAGNAYPKKILSVRLRQINI